MERRDWIKRNAVVGTTIKVVPGFVLENRNNASPENIYIKSVKLNGKNLNRSWLNHDEIIKGGILEFDMINVDVNFIKDER
ncbi:MAG TPA: glycoside hydrolase domain-containing protein [Prolixibacteraceae bacterium]|nr:glycoside hydrolase domain-containing protein [Prolixibacteraceae bacterium]